MGLKIEKTVSIRDFLTTLAIVVSVLALVNTLKQDQFLRQKEQADRVRNAAALTLAKLERLQTLYGSFYLELQPIFVETSEMLARDFDITSTRDFLWKKANEIHFSVLERIIEEEIEVAYTSLYGYHPAVRELFQSALQKLKREEESTYWQFQSDSQAVIFSFADRQKDYQTAELGNALRDTAFHYETIQDEKSREVLEHIIGFLSDLVLMTDREILTIGAAQQLVESAGHLIPSVTNVPTPDAERGLWAPSTPVPIECLDSAYVADVTVLDDNTRFKPWERFVKTWRVQNVGTCPWPPSAQLNVIKDDAIISPGSVFVGWLEVGETNDISVEMIAPGTGGRYQETWQLSDGGRLFGDKLTVAIHVRDVAARTAPPSLHATARPETPSSTPQATFTPPRGQPTSTVPREPPATFSRGEPASTVVPTVPPATSSRGEPTSTIPREPPATSSRGEPTSTVVPTVPPATSSRGGCRHRHSHTQMAARGYRSSA
jgi:hypothetical protein